MDNYTGTFSFIDIYSEYIAALYKEPLLPPEDLVLPLNSFVVLSNGSTSFIGKVNEQGKIAPLCNTKNLESFSGIKPRNKEQHMLLDGMLNKEISLLIAIGKAGVGKTLIASAAAIHLLRTSKYHRLILTKPFTTIGKKHAIAALPGNVKEKFEPYLINFKSNLELFLQKSEMLKWEEQDRIQYLPIQLMLGASFMNTLIIADETQNLTISEMKALGTRIGEGSKLVLLGDLEQVHEAEAKDMKKNGLSRLLNDIRIIESPLTCAIKLIKGERSSLANLIADVL